VARAVAAGKWTPDSRRPRGAARAFWEVRLDMRTLDELVSTQEPAWPMVRSWIEAASNTVTVLPVEATAER